MEIFKEVVDVRKLLKEEREIVVKEFFKRYLRCEANSGRAHRWVGHKYVDSLHAWYDHCEYCGRHRIHQTVGNLLILDASFKIDIALIRNSDFENLAEVRKRLFETMEN